MKYFEDIAEGEVWDLGSRTVDAEEIIAFARKYDPQPFHTDPEAARKTPLGELIASGWHTCAIFMQLLANYIGSRQYASMGAPGIRTCRWLKPVRPGDTLTGRTTLLSKRPSKTRPYGLVDTRTELFNQDGQAVLLIEGAGMYGLKPDRRAEAGS